MKNPFEMLNDVKVDLSEYNEYKLNDSENARIKKRIKSKLKNRKKNSKKSVLVASILILIFLYCGVNANPNVLANVPIIGSVIEEYLNGKYIDSKGKPIEEYKTVVEKAVEDKGVTVKLNEVLFDEGQIIISATFRSNKIDLENASMWPEVYINNINIGGCGSGGGKKIDDATYTVFSCIDMDNVNLKDKLNVKIIYNKIIYDQYKSIKGNWSFEFKATADKLMAKVRTIAINKEFSLDNGQKIIVEKLKLSPISTKLNYKMLNGSKYDVRFIIKDQNGNEIETNLGRTLIENSYARLQALDASVTKLKITPYVFSGEEGEKKTDYHKTLNDEAFEVNIK